MYTHLFKGAQLSNMHTENKPKTLKNHWFLTGFTKQRLKKQKKQKNCLLYKSKPKSNTEMYLNIY